MSKWLVFARCVAEWILQYISLPYHSSVTCVNHVTFIISRVSYIYEFIQHRNFICSSIIQWYCLSWLWHRTSLVREARFTFKVRLFSLLQYFIYFALFLRSWLIVHTDIHIIFSNSVILVFNAFQSCDPKYMLLREIPHIEPDRKITKCDLFQFSDKVPGWTVFFFSLYLKGVIFGIRIENMHYNNWYVSSF